jgi:hypothetical protein
LIAAPAAAAAHVTGRGKAKPDPRLSAIHLLRMYQLAQPVEMLKAEGQLLLPWLAPRARTPGTHCIGLPLTATYVTKTTSNANKLFMLDGAAEASRNRRGAQSSRQACVEHQPCNSSVQYYSYQRLQVFSCFFVEQFYGHQ